MVSSNVISAGFAAPQENKPQIAILKWDRFRAGAVAASARTVYPGGVVRTFHRGLEAVSHLREQPAAIGLLGLTLPDIDGIDVITVVVRERLIGRLLVVSGRRDEHARKFLRHVGINGFFDYSTEDAAALPAAILHVGRGGAYFSHSWQDTDAQDRKPSLTSLLTKTELQIFAVIGDGSDDGSAAERLELSAHTIRTHRERLMRKLGVHTRTELMREALHRGVVRVAEGRVLRPGFDCEIFQQAV